MFQELLVEMENCFNEPDYRTKRSNQQLFLKAHKTSSTTKAAGSDLRGVAVDACRSQVFTFVMQMHR